MSARAAQLVNRLEHRLKTDKNEFNEDEQPAGDAAGTVTEQPADEGGDKPDKSGRKKPGPKPKINHSPAVTTRGKGGRNKAADAKVLAEMESQLQDHWDKKGWE